MKRFKCTVQRTDEYIIELDDTILDEQWMKDYAAVFADYDTYEEHAENIAQYKTVIGDGFIEGYGNPLVNGKKPWHVKEGQENKAVNIIVVGEDCEVDVVEVGKDDEK